MTKFVLFDLDHTISNSSWRDSLIPPNGTWDEYHAELGKDKPHVNCCELVRVFLQQGYAVMGITMRPEKWRPHSLLWLVKHDVPMNWILMRNANDFAPAAESKLLLIENHFNEVQRQDIQFYFDDREDCCAAVTEKFGITSMNVRHRARQ